MGSLQTPRWCLWQQTERWIRLRFPLATMLLLSLWGLAAQSSYLPLSALAANSLLISSYGQLGLLAFVSGLALIFSLSILRAVDYWIARDTDQTPISSDSRPWGFIQYAVVTSLACISPLAVFYYSLNQQQIAGGEIASMSSWLQACLWILVGIASSVIVMLILGRLIGHLIGSRRGSGNFFPGEDRDRRARLYDFSQRPDRHFNAEITIYFAIICGIYFGVLNWWQPVGSWLSVPVYIVIFIWIVLMILARMSVTLDRVRFPTLIALIGLVLAIRVVGAHRAVLPLLPRQGSSAVVRAYELNQSNHGRHLEATDQLASGLDAASRDRNDVELEQLRQRVQRTQAAWQRTERELDGLTWRAVTRRFAGLREAVSPRPPGRTLVIVTCPGGGIHAAAWSAYVLEQLDDRYRDFSPSIVMISGVSGGSLGSMTFALQRYLSTPGAAQPMDPMPTGSWQLAADSSLEAIGSGMLFHDLPAAVIPWLPGTDRGRRLEQAWSQRFDVDDELLRMVAWEQAALKGKMPIMVFNATDAASGRRVLFSSLPLASRGTLAGRIGRPFDFRELYPYPRYDLQVATAVRASATFPYVSPFARFEHPSPPHGERVALGDGGYIDNEGIVTAIDWLDQLALQLEQEELSPEQIPFRRILLLRIQPTSDVEPHGPAEANLGSQLVAHLRWLTGPLEALATMRSTSQIERGQLETDVAAAHLTAPWWSLHRLRISGEELASNFEVNRLRGERTLRPLAQDDGLDQPSFREKQRALDPGSMILQRAVQSSTRQRRESSGEEAGEGDGLAPPSESTTHQFAPRSALVPSESREDDSPDGFAIDDFARFDLPVIVSTIPFTPPDAQTVIPLNWKLSRRQLAWYPYAWQAIMEETAKLSTARRQQPDTTAPVTVLEILDTLFTRRDAADRGPAKNPLSIPNF